jgi:hypothetical protein
MVKSKRAIKVRNQWVINHTLRCLGVMSRRETAISIGIRLAAQTCIAALMACHGARMTSAHGSPTAFPATHATYSYLGIGRAISLQRLHAFYTRFGCLLRTLLATFLRG